ncbi:response regulator [Sinomicrobium kalidii]|uniref:hybrid sensor histidine kinase/response regulator transcription factor n=1 Tax=Sinomicrobium kalidii TaxID=2900738 RepID=UPI001E421B74|nr:hybrid sensor histidine kinase/response regulator transcription factor [Sinomicrobium kalidii]UGU15863.1 response regulator [Sinomicrobium kalidii]
MRRYQPHIVLTVVFIFLIGQGLYAQGKDLYFEHLRYDSDFAESPVSCIMQSHEGFIWLGTFNGLVRYDGYESVRYTRDETREGTLGHNKINALCEDQSGLLWIGTANGVHLFDPQTKFFTPFDISVEKGGRNYIAALLRDKRQDIWAGTFGGLKKIDRGSGRLEGVPPNSPADTLNHSRVLSLFEDTDGSLWVGTATGPFRYDPESNTLQDFPGAFRHIPSFRNAKVWKAVRDPQGDLWFATESRGLFRYVAEKDLFVNYRNTPGAKETLASNWVNDILCVDQQTLWFATIGGLSVFNKKKHTFFSYKHDLLKSHSLSDNTVLCTLKDRDGSIWLGTRGGGINMYNPVNARFMEVGETVPSGFGLNSSMARSVVPGDDGVLWVGTYGGGITRLDFSSRTSRYYTVGKPGKKGNNIVTALENGAGNTLWCGTLEGLFTFDKKHSTFSPVPFNNREKDRPVTSLVRDGPGMWVGTDGQGLKYITRRGEIISYRAGKGPRSISDDFVTSLVIKGEKLWVATLNGLNVIDRASGKNIRVYKRGGAYSLSDNTLTTLFVDSEDRLWIGTDYKGLNYFDEAQQKFFALDESSGLTNESIRGITEDDRQHLWVSADDGLYDIGFRTFSPPFRKKKLSITSYDTKDGVPVRRFSDNAATRLHTGEIVFGGSGGLAVFSPESVTKKPVSRKIVFTALFIDNRKITAAKENFPLNEPIDKTAALTLNYDQGYVGFRFTAMNYINPGSNRYAYKLDQPGFEDSWHEIGTQNTIYFTGLTPGDYTLNMKVTGDDDRWSPHTRTMRIEVLPPWWKSRVAYAVYAVLLLSVSLAVIRFFRNRIRLKRELFIKQVENRQQQQVYQMKLDFFTNISHEIRTPLTLINAPLDNLLRKNGQDEATRNDLKLIKSNSDRLLKLINELMDFRKAESGHLKLLCTKGNIVAFCRKIYASFIPLADKKCITCDFKAESESINLYFDKNQLEKVIYNLMSNALKFTPEGGRVAFHIAKRPGSKKWVDIRIRNNGAGIREQDREAVFTNFFQAGDGNIGNTGSGVGLAFSRSIVNLHKGTIDVESEATGKDNDWMTTFKVALRKGKKHLDNIGKKQEESREMLEEQPVELPVPGSDVPGQEPLVTGREKTIWIVEDNDQIRQFLADILSEIYNVVEFSDGLGVLDDIRQQIPDLVLSDVMMPGMDGFALCSEIKRRESTDHIPVILLTAKTATADQIEGLAFGADAYITKPFSVAVLKLTIANIFAAREKLKQKYGGDYMLSTDIDKLTTPEEKFLKKLRELIEENLDNPDFDVNTLVTDIGMSRAVLYQKVQSLTNYSVAHLIKRIRLKKAEEMIKNTSFSVSEVTYMVGFSDRKYFSREFKKVYGHTPTAYRKIYGNRD